LTACRLPDTAELRTGAVARELVHALHIQQQRAQRPAETLFATTRWVIEGLAVYVSGQLDREFAPQERSRLGTAPLPRTFLGLYADSAFLGLAISLLGFIDAAHGRSTLRALVSARSDAEALAALATTEDALLGAWRAEVVR
jgi:hypothetical protein